MKFLKTLRIDPSDARVFEHAAEPGELAIPGGFWFSGIKDSQLNGKTKQAFSNGFLSLESFGFSTFTCVAEIDEPGIDLISSALGEKLITAFGAPTREAAADAAMGEINFVLEMCSDVSINSIFAIKREFGEKGEMLESFSIVDLPGEPLHTRVWEVVE
ncbi:MAG: DUF6505 family protein [Rhizobiaceae bacterium]